MANEIQTALSQGRSLWGNMPPRRRWLVGGAALATLGLVAFLALRAPTESWSVLFSGLAPDDAAKVVEQLKAQNVPYRLEAGGTLIEVPERVVHEQRLAMAANGLPRGGGVGFEVFDKQTFGTTSFVEQMNYRRALQGELARTITSLDAVERARVHIAIPERSLFKEEERPPTASAVLQLRPGRRLSPGQVRGVVHLISSSVEGLRPEQVTVVDEGGAVLWSGDESGIEAQNDLERTLARRVSELVEKLVGPGHAAVVVTAEVDRAAVERTEELWDKDKIAIRSEAKTEERFAGDSEDSQGVAGARGNLPGAPAPSDGSGLGGMLGRKAETKNYEVNRVVNKRTEPKARVKHLHLAVLLDGVPKPGDPKTMVPRPDAELKKIAAIARTAAGLDEERGDKIEVFSSPFATAKEELAAEGAKAAALTPAMRIGLYAGGAALLLLDDALERREDGFGRGFGHGGGRLAFVGGCPGT